LVSEKRLLEQVWASTLRHHAASVDDSDVSRSSLSPLIEIGGRQTLQGQGAARSESTVIANNKHVQGFRIGSIARLDKDNERTLFPVQ
jgi:hypothetical protein